jgi:AraC-like DNA-binding protein
MNGQVRGMVPVAVAEMAIAPSGAIIAAEVDTRHRGMISGTLAMHELCLEDMSQETMDSIEALIDQFRADFAYCRAHAPLEGRQT